MHVLRSSGLAAQAALLTLAAVMLGCRPAPTEVASLNGRFDLAVWNGVALPAQLPPLPPDTSVRFVQSGALVLNASARTFMYWYVTLNSRGVMLDSESNAGTFAQSGSSISFVVDQGQAPVASFTAQVLSDRIVTSGYTPEMEFVRPQE